MGTVPQQRRQDSESPGVQLETGRIIDDFSRRAQARSDAESSVSSNLTDKGAFYHDITQGTKLSVVVFEEGIWITPERDE